MYLLLSIAAADLWGCCTLLWEARRSDPADPLNDWYEWRKAFGVFMLVTFLALVWASIRVLFYSAYESVEWVIGAAAVLFITEGVSAI